MITTIREKMEAQREYVSILKDAIRGDCDEVLAKERMAEILRDMEDYSNRNIEVLNDTI